MSAEVEAPWAKVPLHVATDDRLTLGDLRVYIAIDYLCGKRGWWYGPQAAICALMGISEPTVQRAINALREAGHISTVRLGLEKRRVTCYYVHARTLNAASVPIMDDGTELSPAIPSVAIIGDSSNTTDLPQTSTTGRAPIKPSAGDGPLTWFEYVCERKPRSKAERDYLESLTVHPHPCIVWCFSEAIGKHDPAQYAKRLFQACLLEGHGPRTKQSVNYRPTSQHDKPDATTAEFAAMARRVQ